jgi:hypothetical protein
MSAYIFFSLVGGWVESHLLLFMKNPSSLEILLLLLLLLYFPASQLKCDLSIEFRP